MKWKRLLALCLCAAMACSITAAAQPIQTPESPTPLWIRSEPGDRYVTVRLYCEGWQDLDWRGTQDLVVRYADTQQPVALTSTFQRGWLFATVPAADLADGGRELEVARLESVKFDDCYYRWSGGEAYSPPQGLDFLNLRAVLQGAGDGNFYPDQVLTRAQAFAILCRLLSLAPAGDPGYADVKPDDWYYDTVSAARAAGLAAQDTHFYPQREVTRGEFVTMLYRTMTHIGWLTAPSADGVLDTPDAASVPDWAKDAYIALTDAGVSVTVGHETGEYTPDGPVSDPYADHTLTMTRKEVTEMVYDTLRDVPVYPTQQAIDWGFDQAMPVIDGSTSTKPYTDAVFGSLFTNYCNHAQWPEKHSKSYYSYERLINGDAHILFASTKPTQDTLDKARAAGVELELIPIAHDAQVFFTHPLNPTEGLTMEQIADIYINNSCTNWSQLGGPDAVFVPYCRNSDSGSQAQMEQFFLKGKEIHPDIRRETTSYSMQSVLTDVYDAYQAEPLTFALGYSIYYYAQAASLTLLPENLKYLKIDGVYPTDETIADGSYPLAGYNYAVIRADSPEDSVARKMAAYMQSEDGQYCVMSAGYGPLTDLSDKE